MPATPGTDDLRKYFLEFDSYKVWTFRPGKTMAEYSDIEYLSKDLETSLINSLSLD